MTVPTKAANIDTTSTILGYCVAHSAMPPISAMKVVQFVPNLNSGGVERGTLEIAQALVNAGHESHVVSNGGRMVDELTAQGSTHHQWALHRKSLITLLEAAALRRWLEDLRPDIIHVRSRMPAWVVWLAWRKMHPANRPRLVQLCTACIRYRGTAKYGQGERVIAVSKTAERPSRSLRGFTAQNSADLPGHRSVRISTQLSAERAMAKGLGNTVSASSG